MNTKPKELIESMPDALLQKALKLSEEYEVSEVTASLALLTTHILMTHLTLEEINGFFNRDGMLSNEQPVSRIRDGKEQNIDY